MNLADYSLTYPKLPFEVLLFFSRDENVNINKPKCLHEFCVYYKEKYQTIDLPQPRVVSKICDILYENDFLSIFQKSGIDNMNSSYWCSLPSNLETNKMFQSQTNKRLSNLIYGFKYIYKEYQKFILPLEYTDNNGDKSLGTCFLYHGGIVTAKHCIEGAKAIAIYGISKTQLEEGTFKIHKNKLMDLLFVHFENPILETLQLNKSAEILDEVMTLGYPKIPGYHNFLTAENAKISARFTASVGQVSSEAESIWIKENLLLITAKIAGGNSGGPVVSKDGSVVGVTVNMSTSEGNYDNLGYGTVIPISFANDLIDNNNTEFFDTRKIEFREFE